MASLLPHQYCQINITVQGVQLTKTIEVARSYPVIIVFRLLVSKRGGATFTEGVNALSVIQKAKKLTLDFQVVRLARFETGFVQKKWSEFRIAGAVR